MVGTQAARTANGEEYLWRVLRDIEPSNARKTAAQRSHVFFRDVLRTGQFAQRVVDDYLSGSYARDTAIEPLEDVDIIFVIAHQYWQSELSAFIGFKPRPEAVLTSFQQAIRYRYPDSSVAMQRRSIGLHMHHLHIDVVPAIAHASKPHHIWIPDRKNDDWIVSGPKIHAKHASAANEKNGSRFKPLVKLLKHWNRSLPSTARLRSFTIETLATRIFSSYEFESLQEGLLKFFDFVVWVDDGPTHLRWSNACGISFFWGSMSVPDVAQTGSNVAAGVDSYRRKRFVENARMSRDRVLEGCRAATRTRAELELRAALRADSSPSRKL